MNKVTRFFGKMGLRKKILFIVDDNELYAKALKEFLGTRFPDAKIGAFPTGEACLAELHQDPDVIIMDHLLNTKSTDAATGLSIIKTIKKGNAGAHIILLSAQKDLSVFVEALSGYGCDYLKKDDQAFGKVALLIKGRGEIPFINMQISDKQVLTNTNN